MRERLRCLVGWARLAEIGFESGGAVEDGVEGIVEGVGGGVFFFEQAGLAVPDPIVLVTCVGADSLRRCRHRRIWGR